MFCRNCGSKIDDTASFCPHCGVPTDDSYYTKTQQQNQQTYGQIQQTQQTTTPNRALVTASKVFIILGFVSFGLSVLVLILVLFGLSSSTSGMNTWNGVILYFIYLFIVIGCGIVGTIFGAKALKNINRGEKPSTAACVCVLIFNSLIAGILLLCSKNEDYKKE